MSITENIIECLKAFAPENSNIDETFDIQGELDSLDLVSFLLNAEDELEVDIDIELLDLEELTSVKRFSKYVEKLR